jgi:hypothetical protein
MGGTGRSPHEASGASVAAATDMAGAAARVSGVRIVFGRGAHGGNRLFPP